MVKKNHPKNKLRLLANLLFLVATIVLAFGIIISLVQANKHPGGHNSPDQPNTAPSTDEPSPENFNSHQVAPDQPRYISIPAISVSAIVKPTGVSADNQIMSPTNVYETGWYNGSTKPGQAGAMLVSGHVSSWQTSGVFYDLKLLQPGDQITIERGDGAKFIYTVSKSETYDAGNVDMEAAMSPIDPNKPGLNLITCAGKVIEGTNEFDKRIVVFAEQN